MRLILAPSACTSKFQPKGGVGGGVGDGEGTADSAQIRAITKAGTYKDGGGLRLVVTARGTKRWELWISINGKRRELGLGVFPDVSLKDARGEPQPCRVGID